MAKRVKKETIKRKAFYPKYLKLVNVILPKPLTLREIDILSAFMELNGDIASERFGTQARRLIKERFKFNSPSNIDNYIKYFKDKGVIIKDKTNKLILNPRINIPEGEKELELTFRYIFKND
jgi:SOS-response transcriptional repressor LexA|tara:strand:- start:2715 stop:3080 length:366 start_codon:yes stop_codon:yes gene_type:complete